MTASIRSMSPRQTSRPTSAVARVAEGYPRQTDAATACDLIHTVLTWDPKEERTEDEGHDRRTKISASPAVTPVPTRG